MSISSTGFRHRELRLTTRIRSISWGLVLLICAAAGIGIATLYSVADGHMQPWAARQAMRFGVALVLMLTVALIDIRYLFRFAYWAYAIALALVVAVDFRGFIGMGAQRWLDLGLFQLQPSELMDVALILTLARYFHTLAAEDVTRVRYLLLPALMTAIPAALVLKQPDLGTAVMMTMTAATIFFLAGVRLHWFFFVAVAIGGSLPVAWRFLREYQKNRIYTFLDPSTDPLGAGYHILQSKIALGSGGMFGKGFLQGTQSHLSFLPEKHTDFIFTTLCEEFGLVGGLTLIGLYALIIVYGYAISLRCRNQFGRLLGLGITTNFFFYIFINTGMVMGLLPVVGVPLPLISYGGTAMLAVMLGFGLLMNVYVHRDVRLNWRGESEPG